MRVKQVLIALTRGVAGVGSISRICWSMPMISLALLRRNLLADAVFLLIKNLLVTLGYVAAVLTGHVPFFLPHLMIVLVQRCRLAFCQRAIFDIVMNSLVLIVEAMIHLLAPRVIFLPGGI